MKLRVWEDTELRASGRTTRMLLAIRDCVDQGDDAVVITETLEQACTLGMKLRTMRISQAKLERIRMRTIYEGLANVEVNDGTVAFVDHGAAELMTKMVLREMRAGVQFDYRGVK